MGSYATSILLGSIAAATCSCNSKPRIPEQPKSVALTKEVLLHEDGQDRHWVMKADNLIKEEHYLTAHGDLYFMIEYPKGVHSPQVDSKREKENAEAIAKGFWRNGKIDTAGRRKSQRPGLRLVA